mmetsp:Transcript_9283/g.22793  ORF Transcript_9283/g.22793 Transcript_9283/m.22793 type:complete len:92 (-) Transcript_9283:64-339(-)
MATVEALMPSVLDTDDLPLLKPITAVFTGHSPAPAEETTAALAAITKISNKMKEATNHTRRGAEAICPPHCRNSSSAGPPSEGRCDGRPVG